MTIIEYTPHSFGARIQHKREIRRMTDGVMPRNTTPALLAVFVAVAILFTLALCGWWNAGAVAETYAQVSVNPESGLNLRQGPGMEYQICGQLANETRLLILDIQNGWVLVAWPKYPEHPMGWVCGDYLEVLR